MNVKKPYPFYNSNNPLLEDANQLDIFLNKPFWIWDQKQHNIKFKETGEPIGPEFIFSGSEIVYTIEVPKSKTERKKLIDEIIGDNFPDEIHYYFKSYDELARRDSTFSCDEFVNCSIEELRKLSFQGGGDKTPGIWRDHDGKLRDKFGQLLTPESGNKEAYQ